MKTEELLVPISALQHWLYCPRQCALIHLEHAWAENRFTAEGQVLHHKAHDGPDESHSGIRITRGMPVSHRGLGLIGQCDVVEFHSDGQILPVEYKRGKPKAHQADEVQLCAQALCLEDMLQVQLSTGHLYYGEKRRRTVVELTPQLRDLCRQTLLSVRACLISQRTPLAEYEPKRCDACSLIDFCQPHAMRFKRGAEAWFHAQLQHDSSPL